MQSCSLQEFSRSTLLDQRYTRITDRLPGTLRTLWYVMTGLIGLATLFAMLGVYAAFIVYCAFRYRHIRIPGIPDRPMYPPVFLAYGETRLRLSQLSVPPEHRHTCTWQAWFHLLQFATFLEYIINKKNPYAYFVLLSHVTMHIQTKTQPTSALAHTNTMSPYFPVGDGLGISRHSVILRHIQNRPVSEPIEKSATLAAWSVSSSILNFCSFIPIFKSSADPQRVKDPTHPGDAELGRKIVFAWLHHFTHQMRDADVMDDAARLRLWRLIPRQCESRAPDDAIMTAVGELLFFLATGGELTKTERLAFLDTVKNPFIFFPDWFNFMVAGHALERRSEASYTTLRGAFARYATGSALQAAFQAAGSIKPPAEVLRLITIVYSVAGSVAPARLSVSILNKLWSDPDRYVPLFHRDPKNFIRECARLYEGIPIMVNVGNMHQTIQEAQQYGIHIHPGTNMHCSMTQANRDPEVFTAPNEFNPARADLMEMMGWNGREADIIQPDESRRPPRYCPGHDLSLDLLVFIVSRFAPMAHASADEVMAAHGMRSLTSTTIPSITLNDGLGHLTIPSTNKPQQETRIRERKHKIKKTEDIYEEDETAANGDHHSTNGEATRAPAAAAVSAAASGKLVSAMDSSGASTSNSISSSTSSSKSNSGSTSRSTSSLTLTCLLNEYTPEELIHCMYDLAEHDITQQYQAVLKSKYYHTLDQYTRLVIGLMHVAVSEWNSTPPRAIDMVLPSNGDKRSKREAIATGQGLKLRRIDMAKFVAEWDEDEPAGSPLKRVIARRLINLPIWSFHDTEVEFDSVEDAIAWRSVFFAGIPRPNVVFYRELDHSNDDALLTQLAFTGCACHHTKLINWEARAQFPGLELLAAQQTTLPPASALVSMRSQSSQTSTPSVSPLVVSSNSTCGPSPSQFHRLIRQHSSGTRGSISHSVIGIPEQSLLHDRAVYVNDMTGLYQFRVRQPYERYGAAVYFDRNFVPVGIYWSHGQCLIRPGEPLWKWASYVWRSSMFAYVTIADHLISNHMIEANALSIASRQWLPPEHPLRHFLKPFTYHTISINYQAAVSLVNNRGLVHRIWAFDYDEFLRVCDYISMNYTFRILPDMIDERMRDRDLGPPNDFTLSHSGESWDKYYPIVRDADEYWDIVHTYVTQFFRIHYGPTYTDRGSVLADKLPADTHLASFIQELCKQLGIAGIVSKTHLIDVISQLIVSGTSLHEQVGQISEYLYDPTFIGCKLRQGHDMNSVQTLTQLLTLAVVTGLKMPGLLEDWSHLIPLGRSHAEFTQHRSNYESFTRQLDNLAKEIDSRNRTRKYPYQAFNPRNLECSTSI